MMEAGIKFAGVGLAILLAGCSGAPDGVTTTSVPAAMTELPTSSVAGVTSNPTLGAAPTDRPGGAANITGAPTPGQPGGSANITGAPTPGQTVETQTSGLGQVVLIVWMPDTLYEASDAPGKQAFLDQLAVFDEQHPEIQVQVYAKRLRGPGGMLSYLKTAPPVAPSIVPDVILVDRDALVEAARAQLVVPIGTVTAPSALADLYPAAADTGAYDGGVTGLPYLLEIDHAAYRQTVISHPPQTFSDVLDSGQLFAFAAGVSSGVSPIFLLQYLAAGGTLVDDKGLAAIDPVALTNVLDFYSEARSRRNVTAELFQVPNTASVWAMYRDRQANLVAVTSTQYLTGLPEVTSTRASTIPTANGKPSALVRGWSWLLVAHSPERQSAALSLLRFLMTPANQGSYSEAAHFLPSQPAALALWASQDSGYPVFADQLLKDANAMPDSSARAAIGVAMQDALEAVVLNSAQPAQAATRAADAVKTGQASQP